MPYREVTEQRLRFLEVDEKTFDSLQRVKQSLDTEFDTLLDKFYAHILQEPELQSLFPNRETMARARQAQKQYWLTHLFAKKVDHRLLEQAEQVAIAHLRIGLSPSWYMSAYCYMLNQFVELAHVTHEGDPGKAALAVKALNKLVFLDMNTVLDMYFEAKNASMRDLLFRATTFSEDATGLVSELENAQQDLQGKIDAGAESAEISASATRLSSHVKTLASRLEKFHTSDRLSTAHHELEEGFTARLRRLIVGK
ncbi:MAG: protoglobin domain-containing protein [Gammaproteobacteria bacterium]|nr:protoglobin domain-containing protein [Gammaproteobacteria bacterium]